MGEIQRANRRASIALGLLAAALIGPFIALLAACGSAGRGGEPAVPAPGARVGLVEAESMVRALIFEEKPAMSESMEVPLVELTTDEMWERLGIQLFQVTEGVCACQAYLTFGGRAHHLCGGFGGHGVQSACVTDLDGDGAAELTYTYSWGSGIHRSLVGVCRVDGDGLLQGEPGVAYVGDLFVRKESDTRVIVEIGRYGWEFSSWVAEAPFGVLELESADGRWSPRIELAELSEEHSKRLWR